MGKNLQEILNISPENTYYYTDSSTSLFQILRAVLKGYHSLSVTAGITDHFETISPNEALSGSESELLPAYSTDKHYTIPQLPTTKGLAIRRALVERNLS